MQKQRDDGFEKCRETREEAQGGGTATGRLISDQHHHKGGNNPAMAAESATALQAFLDRIPINSITGLNNSSTVLDLKTRDCLGDAIRLLYEKNVFGAAIADDGLEEEETTIGRRQADRYIGFIDFSRMVLWSLRECEKTDTLADDKNSNGFFSMLEHNPHIAKIQVGDLAKSFLWDPFLPVRSSDSLFHVLLLLSKHRLHFVPVTEPSSTRLIGFVTQNAVISLLLQSSGLEWFDNIADMGLSDIRFENEEHAVFVYGDQSIAETMHILWESRIGAAAVMERGTKRLIGSLSNSDLYIFLDNNDVFNNRKSLTAQELIRMQGKKADSDPSIEQDLGASLPTGVLNLRNNSLPRIDSPVTIRKTDTLKQAMERLTITNCSFCFIVDELRQVQGVLTLKDIISQFAPPCIDSRINGGGFFDTALEQTGCHIEAGTMICDH
ncbi:SNF1-related protein kinase regulatory subunit gamma-1-like isoform X3 [Diospyros lotus]|uniref:SNF1-related protein kinase regulatory subunit gamma-1-like isoform X3 n=1 Tax=Diospyros lotus TaxID=55363 RepID=UPI002258D62E|nr:SNF1-related protein kinase regulatory subunit gamma-1-like isoform X3 [Diospyros lotus]